MNDAPLYNSSLIKTYVEYLRHKNPHLQMEDLLRDAGISSYQLEDGGHWFTQAEIERFYERVAIPIDGPTSAREAGRYSATSQAASIIRQYATSFLTPSVAYWMAEKLAAGLTRHITFKVNKVAVNKVEIVVIPRPGVEERSYQCENRIGTIEAVAQVFTKKYAQVEHPQCLHQGSDYCRYLVTWERQPYQRWEMIGRHAALWAGLSFPLLALLLPFSYLPGYVLSCALLSLGSFLYAKTLLSRDLAAHLENQGSAADLLINQLNIRHNESLLIRELGQASASILDIDRLLQFYMQAMEKHLDFDRGMILLADKKSRCLRYASGYGYDPSEEEYLKNISFRLDNPESKGPLVLTYKERKHFIVNDIKALDEKLSPKSREFARQLGIQSFVSVPIAHKDGPDGVLAMSNKSPRRQYTESDISLLTGIAHQVAISMNNAASHMKLKESEAQFRSLTENAPDIIYTLDREGAITYVNPAWERIMGYSREETIGRYFSHFVKAGEEDRYRDIQLQINKDKKTVQNFDGTLINNQGSEHIFIMNCTPNLDENGEITGLMGILKDVTEQRRLESQLHQAAKMEAIGRLTGGISHDFNNFLQAIGGNNQLLLIRKPPEDPDRKYLENIEQLTQKATALLKQMMLFSRKLEPAKRPLSINEEIMNFQELLGSVIPKMIAIELKLADDLKSFSADPVHIHQIIMNLAINARDAMPAGGKITITTKNVLFAESTYIDNIHIPPGPYVQLVFTDTGIGMNEENRSSIFEPFFTTKAVGKGTGLGLSVVYGIVKNHGGYIFCTSKPAQGASFHIYFPVEDFTPEKIIAAEQPTMHGAACPGETILLVDDENSILETTEEILTLTGYRVIKAQDGLEALNIYRWEPGAFHLVILDLIMPGMGGYECLQELVKINPCVKVIITSGYTAQITAQAVIDAGACRFIEKPYNYDQFLAEIRGVLHEPGVSR